MRAVAFDPDLLTARQEGAVVGKDETTVSRARRDPTHPIHTDPRAISVQVGGRGSILVPKDAAVAWWRARDAEKTARATTAPPEGLTRTQWQALQDLATAGTAPSRTTRTRLTARGWLDDTGALTAASLEVLAARGITPQKRP